MKSKVIDFKDLSVSRELVEHKIPNFMLWFFYFIVVLLATSLVWSYYGTKEIVVQSSGIVRSENEQIVVPLVSGEVKQVYFDEGDTVKAGDLILEMFATSIDMDLLNYTNALNQQRENLVLEELYLTSVELEENKFDIENINHVTKYYDFEAYLTLLESSENPDRTRQEKIASLTSSIEQLTNTISQYENEIEKLEYQVSNYKVYAEYDGVVHYTNVVNTGSSIQAGYELLRVYEQVDNTLEIQLYVLNSDIAKVEVGQLIRVEIPSLSPRTYGYASAEVISIEADSRVDQSSGQSFYIITAKLNETSLSDEDIIIGMQVKGRMIVDEQRYLYWMIEKLELWIFD